MLLKMTGQHYNSLQLGKVLQLQNDPEGEFRVLITIPLIDETRDGVWARVACLDAGLNRGMFFRPEIGDDVIVGFLDHDLLQPVLLGSINSKDKPPAIPPTDANNEKGFISRSKIRLIIDDITETITIDTPAGNSITLDEGNNMIRIKDQNQNIISMTAAGITIESPGDIQLKAGSDITLSAASSLSLNGEILSVKATQEVSVESSNTRLIAQGINEITGSLVKIN
jgi:uncharacterized protein involved in type VI secretion and phage assembly